MSLIVDRVFPTMFKETKHKQEAVPREDHVHLAHPLQLLPPQPLVTHQLQLPVTRAISRSIFLKQPRRPAEVAGELEVLVGDVPEEQAVPTLQVLVLALAQQLEQKVPLPVSAISISCATTPNSSSFVRLCRPSHVC